MAIHHHHEPDSVTDHRSVLAHALHAGDVLAHWVEDSGMAGPAELDASILELLKTFGVDESGASELISQIQTRFEEMSNRAYPARS